MTGVFMGRFIGKKGKFSRKKHKKYLAIILIIISISVIFIFMQYNNKVLPVALEISKQYAVTRINEKINTAVEKVISELNVTTKDFFDKSFDSSEKINYFSANTILINKVCSKTSAEISNSIKNSENEKIELPIGIFSGIELLSNIGPNFEISLKETGNTVADYETSFESQGINQVNLKIWLVTKTEVLIANPFYSEKTTVKRKIMLINTIFNGTVPQTYLNMSKNTKNTN